MMPKLNLNIIDKVTKENVAARVQILDSQGEFLSPATSILKIGPGSPFFYSDGLVECDVSTGPLQVLVERGTEYIPNMISVDVFNGQKDISVEMAKWSNLEDQGWHPGNTHIHYDEKEQDPDGRLQLDPRVENLRMTAVSILKRWDLEYATNKFAPGMLNDFSSEGYYVECGEENRHNANGSHEIGYGHIMLLNIRNIVHPVSRGLLVDAFDPDYPPLSYACDDAHRQGGIVIWCHNGNGMEAPVAGALGKVDAFNVFDPTWMEPEYDIYYKMLNTGIELPLSTGSDWFVSNANRVYAYTGSTFDYEDWLKALISGKTFVTNGPAIYLEANDAVVGDIIQLESNETVNGIIKWDSNFPVNDVQLIYNGEIIVSRNFQQGLKEGSIQFDLELGFEGWIAARLHSGSRDSFNQPVFAHTSPIYLKNGRYSDARKQSAKWFSDRIEDSKYWIGTKGKFYNNKQRREVMDLFNHAQAIYKQKS